MTDTPQSTTPKPFVFVLMPFDTKFDDIYTFGIKGAAEDAGGYAERLDEQIFAEGMLDRIFNQISKADVVVADMTGRNANVFYEVGYAHALGKLVLLLTQDAGDIPFDLKHRQHIVYGGSINKVRAQLTKNLRWAIAEAKRQTNRREPEKLLVSVMGIDVPEVGTAVTPPTIECKSDDNRLTLAVAVRNPSPEPSPGVTHVYLLTPADCPLMPYRPNPEVPPERSGAPVRGFKLKSYAVALDTIETQPSDAEQGFSKQFRLNVEVAALPPGAVETFPVMLVAEGHPDGASCMLKLRMHTSSTFRDYVWRLRFEKRSSSERQPPIVDVKLH